MKLAVKDRNGTVRQSKAVAHTRQETKTHLIRKTAREKNVCCVWSRRVA